MKIHTSIPHSFELSEADMLAATKLQLQILLKDGQYLRSKNGISWVCQDDPHWRHGSVSEDYMREASELDIAIFTVMKALNGNKL